MSGVRIHPRGIAVLTGFAALMFVAHDVRLGMAAATAAAVIDWLSFAGLVSGAPALKR
jgi:hypothetical protein